MHKKCINNTIKQGVDASELLIFRGLYSSIIGQRCVLRTWGQMQDRDNLLQIAENESQSCIFRIKKNFF